MPGPLDGIRIVDLSAVVSGPYATQMLGDLGADVIKIEQPDVGDVVRRYGPMRDGMAAGFAVINRSKRAIALNLQTEEGKGIFLDLVKTADVVVQNFRPGVVDRIGIGYEASRKVKPDIIYVSVTGYGSDGPYAKARVYDPIIQAITGYDDVQSDPKTRVPAPVRNIVCDKVTSHNIVQAVLAALFARERGAGGQHVELAMIEAGLSFLWPDAMYNHTYIGDDVKPIPDLADTYHVTPTSDGYVAWFATGDDEYQGLCRAIERPDLADDERFKLVQNRAANMNHLMDIVIPSMKKFSTAEVIERFDREQVPCAKINRRAEVPDDPQIRHIGAIVETEHPHVGRLRYPRPPIQFRKTPAEISRPAPQLGEQTDEVLSELGLDAQKLAALRQAGIIA